jgi:hypothetical protein
MFLQALANPDDEQHAEMLDWIGKHFDPRFVDIEMLTASIHRIARKGSRRPPTKKPEAN